jgi:hypothetical protein
MTLEQLALATVRRQFPNLRQKGFSRAVRAETEDSEYRIRFLPDGWTMDGDDFVAIEIEDANELSMDKLWQYCDLWSHLDFYDLGLRLFVFDRYGHNGRELDLCDLFYNFITDVANVGALRREFGVEA